VVGVSDAVTGVGPVEDVVAEIDKAHAALMCSRSEAFGRVTVEYLRRGRPVIGTRSGGTPELIDDGRTGLLYSPGDTRALADRIESLASSNLVLKELSRNALERTANRFLYSDYVHDFCGILEGARSDEQVQAE
jgi:glycosyltransferase involved in cell wall biosynthesis